MSQKNPQGHSRKISESRVNCFRRNMLKWFSSNGRQFPWRNPDQTTYQLIVTEILLQRTRAESVSHAYSSFFKLFPSWKALSGGSEDQLQAALEPLGLWRRRAESITALASFIASRNGRFPKERQEVECLPGIGQYIVNAIQLIRGLERAPLLDVNMSRILERYFGPRQLADIRYDPYLQELAWRVCDTQEALKLNWAVLDLGALACRPKNPKCQTCPLKKGCNYARGVSVERKNERGSLRICVNCQKVGHPR